MAGTSSRMIDSQEAGDRQARAERRQDHDVSASRASCPSSSRSSGRLRIVIDSVSLLNMLFENEHERRTNLFNLSQMIKRTGATCLMTAEVKDENPLASRDGLVEYVADGVISLRYVERVEKSELQLSLRIIKMRRTNHSRKITPYEITDQGHRGARGLGDRSERLLGTKEY